MTFDVALSTAVVLLTVLVAGLLRVQTHSIRRIDVLERRLQRLTRKQPTASGAAPVDTSSRKQTNVQETTAQHTSGPPALAEGAVDVEGVSPFGLPVTIPLESSPRPTLLAFLSTSCGICTGIWQQLRDGGLNQVAPEVMPVVVTKDVDQEDHARISGMVTEDSALPVVLAGEAWDDYEVPGSPYLLLVSGQPGSVIAEGSVAGWADVVSLVSRAGVAWPAEHDRSR